MDRPVAAMDRRIELVGRAPFRVGSATVDPLSHEARFADTVERLQPQTIKVLIALAERSGEVVTRDELVERCWDGRYVGDDVLNRSILLLRRFATHAGGFAIETIPRTGYRLTEQAGARSFPWKRAGAALATLALVAAGVAFVQHRNDARPALPTVALIPFTSGPEQEARDIAAASGDALSHMLLAGSYSPRLDWPASAADRRNDDLVLSGDVRQIAAGYTAVVQLRDRRTGTVIFSRQYEASPSSAADLPERIGAEMSSNLTGALAMLILDRRRPVQPEIAADMLKQIGMTVQGQDPLAAYAVSRRLAEKDPDSPLPQIALSFDTGFALGSLPRAERPEAVRLGRIAADKAQRLAPEFGDTYVPWCLLHPKYRIGECEDRMRAGLKADPDAPFVPAFLSSLLLDAGRQREALEQARATLSDHPYQPHKLRRVIGLLILLGATEDGEQLFAKARRWWPEHGDLYWDRMTAYALRGDVEGVARAIQDTPPAGLLFDRARLEQIIAAWRSGQAPALRQACRDEGLHYEDQLLCLAALSKTGDRDTAFHIADRASPALITGSPARDEQRWLDDPYAGPEAILSAPATSWLRSDPRFLPLVERTGLAAYWRSGRLPDFCTVDREPVCKAFAARRGTRSPANP